LAKINYLLQGINEKSHIQFIEEILKLPDIKKVIFSVAFMKKRGLLLLEEHLKPFYNITDIYVGIRNGVTSVQAIMELVKNDIKPYLVDTGTNSFIFHPKIFLSYSDTEAKVIVGSANATSGGFLNNIEASTLLHLYRSNTEDEHLLNQIINSINTLASEFPNNVTQISSAKEVIKVFREGRLFDERSSPNPSTSLKSTSKSPEFVPRMKLKTRRIKIESSVPKKTKKRAKTVVLQQHKTHQWILLWESGSLKERDLNIPSGSNTNPTGSMYLKKGSMENIDQRHYFREEIFNNLKWVRDTAPRTSHYERAYAKFEIIIKGISYGIYKLKLSHNTRTDSKTYEQNNSVTQIHWGDAKHVIARNDLLGQLLRIYKPENEDSYFIMEIE
jgi:HKD family nuclease